MLTESGAMLAYLNDRFPDAELFPLCGTDKRAKFWRWLYFINSEIYPTFTYYDVPTRFVSSEVCGKQLRNGVGSWRRYLWILVEERCGTPFFLGNSLTAIDFYLWVMNHWKPGREWFDEQCPRICKIADRVGGQQWIQKVRQRNFPLQQVLTQKSLRDHRGGSFCA